MADSKAAAAAAAESNPAMTIVVLVLGFLVVAMGVNVFLWWKAQSEAGPRKSKKALGAKAKKRQILKQGLQMPSE